MRQNKIRTKILWSFQRIFAVTIGMAKAKLHGWSNEWNDRCIDSVSLRAQDLANTIPRPRKGRADTNILFPTAEEVDRSYLLLTQSPFIVPHNKACCGYACPRDGPVPGHTAHALREATAATPHPTFPAAATAEAKASAPWRPRWLEGHL